MGNVKPKWGARAAYWVGEFKLTNAMRRQITGALGGNVPEGFYKRLEEIVADYLAWTEYEENAPTPAHVKAALKEVSRKGRALAKVLDPNTGLDQRSRQTIAQVCALRGLSRDIVKSCAQSVHCLLGVVEITRMMIKPRQGRKIHTNQALARDLFDLFEHFNLNPRAALKNPYEEILSILLYGKYAESRDNVHRLALAAKRSSVG